MANEKVFEKTGVIESKVEATSSKGKAYWKVKISGDFMFNFDHKSMEGLDEGTNVKVYWTESGSGGKVFKTITSIFPDELIEPEENIVDNSTQTTFVSGNEAKKGTSTEFKGTKTEPDVYELGMAKNNATIIFAKLLDSFKSIDEKKEFLLKEGDFWEDLVVSFFKRGKRLRGELLDM